MKSYLKFLSRNKVYTFISVAGLAVSLMFVILLGDYAWRQFSIDRWHKNADRICLMGTEHMFFMWPQEAKEIKGMCPEVEETCCVMSQMGRIKHGEQEVKDGDSENGIIMLADQTFFRFFDFELTRGDRQTALDAPDKCVITERLAKRLFGDRSPIGESLQIVGERGVTIGGQQDPYDSTLVYTVSAVVKDLDRTVLPNETQVIVSMECFPQVMGYELNGNVLAYGGTGPCKAFFMLRPGSTLDSKKSLIGKHLKEAHPSAWGDYKLILTPLTDVMFAPQNSGDGLQKGDKTRLQILLAAVLAILFFAVSNYINLTVANTGFRAKEMATRRLFGSTGTRVSLKLIAESTLMVALSFAIGLTLAFCFEQDAASLFRGKIALDSDVSFATVSVCLGFILLVGIVSGILPSWHLSRYQPIDIVKGTFRFRSKMVLSRVFIVVQNVVTMVMLTAALVIWLQLNHLIHAPLGYNTENLYYVYPPEGKEQAMRAKLEAMPFVERIGTCYGTTFTQYNTNARGVKRGDKYVMLLMTEVDSTAFDLLGLKVLQDYGRTSGGYYLTEEALRKLDYTREDREIDWGDGDKDPIEGVLGDIHVTNVLRDFQPVAIRLTDNIKRPGYLVKTNGDKRAKAAFIQLLREMGADEGEEEWGVIGMEESIEETFEEHQNTLRIISLFAIVAVIISVMGFVGMSLFFIRQRKKDIGIRKIMGSTTREVMWLMLRTFCMPLLVSFVIAVPLSYYIMARWLEDFSYRIALSPWIFAATCAFSLLVAVLSVGFQIWRATRANPVESIKTE